MSDGSAAGGGSDPAAGEGPDPAAGEGPDPAAARDARSGRLADLGPQVGIGVCYLATVLGGMALADEAAAAGLAAFENAHSVGNVGVFAVYVLLGTVFMLLAFRYGRGIDLIRLFLAAVFGAMAANALLLLTGVGGVADATSALGGLPATPLGAGLAVAFVAALWVYPEWYVIDVVGILGGAAVIPMFGLGFGPLPIVVLLVVWAGYDAYAVYGSGHMKELASGVGDLKVPVVFVVPTELGASFRDAEFPDLSAEDDGDESSDAAEADPLPVTLLGLGDAIIPGMLAVSAGRFLDAPTVIPALNANAPALGALLGGVVGLAALGYIAREFEGVHAGLPPLNAGVLGGYLAGSLAAGLPLAAALGL